MISAPLGNEDRTSGTNSDPGEPWFKMPVSQTKVQQLGISREGNVKAERLICPTLSWQAQCELC